MTVRRCAARTDFLPYRIEGIPAQTDVLLSGSALLPCSEPAQRYCAAASFLYAQTASDLFLRDRSAERYCAADFGLPFFLPYRAKQSRRDSAPPRCCVDGIPTGNVRSAPAAYSDLFLCCRQAVPGCAECQAAKLECLALHWARLYSMRPAVCQAAAQRCCVAARIRSVPSDPVRCRYDAIFLRNRLADWYCAANFGLPLFLPCRAKQSRRDSALLCCCADGIPTENVRSAPAAYSV